MPLNRLHVLLATFLAPFLTSIAHADLEADSRLELVRMAYALAGSYGDIGRMTVTIDDGETQEFLFRTLFSEAGPFRFEFRGETHPELVLIRSDGQTIGYFWSADGEEMPVPNVPAALLRAGPPTSGLALWIPMLLFPDRPNSAVFLEAQQVRTGQTIDAGKNASIQELILDPNTVIERSIWVDTDTHLIQQIETSRTTDRGTASISIELQPQVNITIDPDAFTASAIDPSADGFEIQEADSIPIPAGEEVIASVYRIPIYLEDLYPGQIPPEGQVQATIGQQLAAIVFRDAMETFAEARDYEIRQSYVDAYVQSRIRQLGRDREAWSSELLNPEVDTQQRRQIELMIETIDSQLQQDETALQAELAREGVEMVTLWQFNRDLYERYGGRVIHSETGPEPIEAYRRFIEDQAERGFIEIRIDALERPFWQAFDPPVVYEIPESQVSFERPWWMHGTVDTQRR